MKQGAINRCIILLLKGLLVLGVVTMLCGCSINNIVSNALSESLGSSSGSTNPLLSDNDPELVGDALPFTLKFFDLLISSNIDNPPILLTTGQSYIAYSSVYLQGRALVTPRTNLDEQDRLLARAKNLYLRGQRYCMEALEKRHPGFGEALFNTESDESIAIFEELTEEDVPYLYWAALGLLGAFSTDTFDFELAVGIGRAAKMMDEAFRLDPEYGDGAIHEFYITYYAALPEALGGSVERARHHYQEAVRLSSNNSVSAHLALATGVAIPAQDIEEFITLTNKALAVDVNVDLNRRLLNIVKKREAQWYLENLDHFFIDYESTDEVN